MGGDMAWPTAEVTPYVPEAVGAYAGAVLAKLQDEGEPQDGDALAAVRLVMRSHAGLRRVPDGCPQISR